MIAQPTKLVFSQVFPHLKMEVSDADPVDSAVSQPGQRGVMLERMEPKKYGSSFQNRVFLEGLGMFSAHVACVKR